MKELLKSNDHILISYIRSLLDDENIFNDVFDKEVNNMFTGMLGSPMRIMVKDEDFYKAKEILRVSGVRA